jgi:hypothetical protein
VGRVRFGFGRIRSSKFDKKNCQVTRQIRVDLVRVGSDFRSNTINFFRVSGDFESGRVSGSYELSLFRASSHSGPGRVGFRVI